MVAVVLYPDPQKRSDIRDTNDGRFTIYTDHYIGPADLVETYGAVPTYGALRSKDELNGLPVATTTEYGPRLVHSHVYEQRDGSQYNVDLVWIEVRQKTEGTDGNTGLEEIYRSPSYRTGAHFKDRQIIYITDTVGDAATPDGSQTIESRSTNQADDHFLQEVTIEPNFLGALHKVVYSYRAVRTESSASGVLHLFGSRKRHKTQEFEDIVTNQVTDDTADFTNAAYGADGSNRYETGTSDVQDHMLIDSRFTPDWILGVARIDTVYRRTYTATTDDLSTPSASASATPSSSTSSSPSAS